MAYYKFMLGSWRLAFYARKVEWIDGVNSKLRDGRHCLMLDVEGPSLRQIENEAARIADKWELGPLHIFETGRPDSFHIYGTTRLEWERAMQIAVDFRWVDPMHLVWSLRRGHFTLRFSPKMARLIAPVSMVWGPGPIDMRQADLCSFTRYQTSGAD